VKRVWPAIGAAALVLVAGFVVMFIVTFIWFNPKDSEGIPLPRTAALDAALATFLGFTMLGAIALAIVAGVATYIFRTPKR
jgi:hypothetical protein